MSIRLLALDLYRVLQEVNKVKAELESADTTNRVKIEAKLRNIQAEEIRLRRAMDGMKDDM
jgi:hypothetical protein